MRLCYHVTTFWLFYIAIAGDGSSDPAGTEGMENENEEEAEQAEETELTTEFEEGEQEEIINPVETNLQIVVSYLPNFSVSIFFNDEYLLLNAPMQLCEY